MDQIQSMSIEDLTKPPTLAPTTYAYWLANQDNDELEETALEEPEVNTFMIGVGLGVGAIWCCLTAITLTFLYKARSAMNEDKDMEDLLRQEKANPLEAKGSVGENTDESDGEANPMEGDEEDPKMDDGDASVNSHLTDSVGDVDEWEDNNKRRGSVSSKLRASTVSKASLKSSMSKPMSRINSFRSSGTSSVGMRKSMTGSVGMRKSMTGSVGMHKSGNRKSVTSKAARSMSLAPQKNSIQLDEDYKPPRRVSSQPEFKGDFRSSVKGPRNSFAPQNRVAGRKTRTQSVIVKSGAAPAAQPRRSSDFGEEPNKTRRLDGRQSIIKKTID